MRQRGSRLLALAATVLLRRAARRRRRSRSAATSARTCRASAPGTGSKATPCSCARRSATTRRVEAQLSALLESALRERGLERAPGGGELRVAALLVGTRTLSGVSAARARCRRSTATTTSAATRCRREDVERRAGRPLPARDLRHRTAPGADDLAGGVGAAPLGRMRSPPRRRGGEPARGLSARAARARSAGIALVATPEHEKFPARRGRLSGKLPAHASPVPGAPNRRRGVLFAWLAGLIAPAPGSAAEDEAEAEARRSRGEADSRGRGEPRRRLRPRSRRTGTTRWSTTRTWGSI